MTSSQDLRLTPDSASRFMGNLKIMSATVVVSALLPVGNGKGHNSRETINVSVTAPPTELETKASSGFSDTAGCFSRLPVVKLMVM